MSWFKLNELIYLFVKINKSNFSNCWWEKNDVIQIKNSIENLMDYPGPNEPGRRYPGRPHGPHAPRPRMKKKNP